MATSRTPPWLAFQDRDVGVGVFPEREQIIVRGADLSGVAVRSLPRVLCRQAGFPDIANSLRTGGGALLVAARLF